MTPAPTRLPEAAREVLRTLWAWPAPVLLQDAQFRIVDANPAFEAFSGRPLERLRGSELVDLQPAEEREADRAARAGWLAELAAGGAATLTDRRLVDAQGQERWFRATWTPLKGAEGPLVLVLLQDTSGEHAAQALSERSLAELTQWFELSPSGMLVFDAAGLIVRSNRAFEGLVGLVPVTLAEASSELQMLLAWHAGRPSDQLVPGAPPLACHAIVGAGDQRRRLEARVSAVATLGREPRYMAVVEDRNAEEERDLAQLERGALMDSAGIGVATYDSGRGWLAPPTAPSGTTWAAPGLQGISRDMVDAASRPEYERLQQALRHGERVEVRYAVQHPELGVRWLHTRVEPGALAGGRRATSVVTLDVTDQERARQRAEQLLRELETILEGSTAGIAYLRGAVLARCNRPFECMLGIEPGAGAGAGLEELLGACAASQQVARDAAAALCAGRQFQGELAFQPGAAPARWYSLSLQPAESGSPQAEAVAVLTDITGLKRQQAELEASLQDRELMFSLTEVGIVFQRGARIERANQAMAALTGYSTPELTALDAAELYETARDCVAFEARMAQALARSGRFVGERQLRRRDRQLRWVQVGARLIDPDQPERGLICSFVDVDELHEARESLLRQTDRTRSILDSVLVGIVTVSDSGIEWMNRSARRMFAGELADFVGEPISTVATSEPDHPLRRTDYARRLEEGQAETFECRLRGRDGREFWVVGNAVVTGRESLGRQITFALLDIERRRQAEESTAQARSSLQRVIDTAPLAIALLDAVSQEALQRNQTAEQFFSPAPHGLTQALADAGRPDGAPARLELRQTLDEGDAERVWDTRLVSLPASAATPAQLLVVASDVTEQREADRARLQAAIVQREVLVKEVHHRIKNNLQGVAGLLQMYAERRPDVAEPLGEAIGQVRAIAQVYGLQVGDIGLLRVAHVVEAIAQSVQRIFGRTIKFERLGEEAAAYFLPEAESTPIALTLNELLTNAVKHGSGAAVRCTLRAEDGGVLVEIRHPGRLPAQFDLARYPGGVSGLGLVRALLPRRSAALSLTQEGAEVCTKVSLRPPSVRADAALPIGDNPAQEDRA